MPSTESAPRDLVSWWKQFKRTTNKTPTTSLSAEEPASIIFSVPLAVSIRYANVAISLFDSEGRSFIYGYVPIVVAKCGVFLKEKATEVEGIFRLAGATRRINELYTQFNTPDRFGKGLDWTGYTVHDAANVLRRYLNSLPESVVPLDFYERFREPLRHCQAPAVTEQNQQQAENGGFNASTAIRMYQQLITELPPLNRQLLLYLLDLLAVFAAKSDLNLMTSYNLSAIFQPALLFHPVHTMVPGEYRLNQDVLIFLIENQDHFLVGMQGTAVDEKTIQEVQSGLPSPQNLPSGPNTPKTKTQQILGRSASTTSAGSESARRFSLMRRNVSVSSKNSRQSNNAPSPITPPLGSPLVLGGKGNGIHRSNTVPSKKSPSPALVSERFSKERTPETHVQAVNGPGARPMGSQHSSSSGSTTASKRITFHPSVDHPPSRSPSRSPRTSLDGGPQSIYFRANQKLILEPGIEHLLERPKPEREKKQSRRSRKLQKKRALESVGMGVHSKKELKKRARETLASSSNSTLSTNSSHSTDAGSHPSSQIHPPPSSSFTPTVHAPSAQAVRTGVTPSYTIAQPSPDASMLPENPHLTTPGASLKPERSPTGSVVSSGSSPEREGASELEEKTQKKRRWRISTSAKKGSKQVNGSNLEAAALGLAPGAERSTSTVGSATRSRKSMTDDSYPSNVSAKPSMGTGGEERSGAPAPDKKGPFGWIRDKLQRAKSPVPAGASADATKSKQSLTAVANNSDTSQGRGRSVEAFGEVSREEVTN